MNGYSKYKLVDYFDVWGNVEDGYEVNNLCTVADDIWLSDDCTDQEILSYLKTIKFLNTDDMSKVALDGDGVMIEIYEVETEMPLGRLECIM